MTSDPRFFVLEEEHHGPHETHFSRGDDASFGEAPRCLKCGGVIGMLEWLPPYRGEVAVHGQKGAGDFMLGPGYGLVVSGRFAQAFRQEGLTGLAGFHPTEVQPLEVPRYLFVSVAFGRAAIDEARSRLRRPGVVTCDECRSTGLLEGIYGFNLERGTWSGEDVFRPRGLQGSVVVTERFTRLVADHALTNIKLTPAEQYVWDPLRLGPPLPGGAAPRPP